MAESSLPQLTDEELQELKEQLRAKRRTLEFFAGRVERLLFDLLEDHPDIGRNLHAIKVRVKAEDSFLKKCKDGNYHDPFNELKDVVGARVILYSRSKKETVQSILNQHLYVKEVKDHSHHDESLYDGLHLICTVNLQRAELPEWSRYKDQVFEIQITTVAHNAWSEVEHRAIYKSTTELDDHHKELLNSANAHLKHADECIEGVIAYLDFAEAQAEALTAAEEADHAE